MATTAAIESQDVIRLVLQFCKENGLHRTVQTLQEESRVGLNTVDSREQFLSDVNHGHWHKVLQTVSYLTMPDNVLMDLYELVAFELMDLREHETAQHLLKETAPLLTMKNDHPERYKRLEQFLKKPHFDAKEAFEGLTKEKKRSQVAQAMVPHIQVAPPSRLLALIGQAMKWQHHVGVLQPDEKMDLFRGISARNQEEIADECARSVTLNIIFGEKTHPECAGFSPDGQFLATGTADGFIELWDHRNGKLRKDLEYQAAGEFMVHEHPVVSLCFSKDSELLASGSQDGQLKVWKVANGECVKNIEKAHDDGICWIAWSRDSTQLLTSSFDMSARIQGLKSGKTIKVFRGHTSFVNSAVYIPDGTKVLTASADGRIKLWDSRTTECIATFSPPPPAHMSSAHMVSANMAIMVPNSDQEPLIYVSTRCSQIFVMNLTGQVLKTFSSGKREGGDFSAICVSPHNKWLYGLCEDKKLYAFSVDSGTLARIIIDICTKDPIAVTHHPTRNVIAAVATDGKVALMSPKKNAE
eukprot:GEMP01030268.1.p1 GENE.GEMP01030268.1~~GEMP01030268.1.p1  ORF type:complete len:527 (+),score=94.55 GEMP01030268.1:149-1729(+)